MTHLPYIAASYGLAVATGASYAIAAWTRMRRAQKRLNMLDPRPSAARPNTARVRQ